MQPRNENLKGACPAHIRPSGLREIPSGCSGSANRLAGRLTCLQWQNAIFRDLHAPGAVHSGFSESHEYGGRTVPRHWERSRQRLDCDVQWFSVVGRYAQRCCPD